MKKSIGIWGAWALVVGTMIGNGIFMLPQLLAPYGSMSLLGWVFAGGGTLTIVFTLSSLSRRISKLGGPYAYTREAFGDLPGFLVAWGYWISIWSALAAGSVAFTSYLSYFIPQLSSVPIYGAISSILLIWLIVGINIRGTKTVGVFQIITTLLKLLPLFLIAASGFLFGDLSNIPAQNPDGTALPILIAEMILLIMWAYVGVEGITVPTDDIIQPEKTIPRALILGTITATIVYLVATYGVMAIVPNETLINSTSPFADASLIIFGKWGGGLVAIAAIISIVGSLNGQGFFVGIIPRAMALDHLFPKQFAKLNKSGAPSFSLVLSGLLASLVISLNYAKGLRGAFELLIILSTLTTLLPYTASSLAELYFIRKDRLKGLKRDYFKILIAIGALIFSIFVIFGSGWEELIYGLILLGIGLLVYFFIRKKVN